MLWLFFVVGGMALAKVEQPVFEFINDFCEKLRKLNEHDFIAEQQSNYFKNLKQNLDENSLIVLMDFSENIAFEIQFAAQAYYYQKPQCTIHPICLYFKQNGELKEKSIIIIAESLNHNVTSVYLFQTKLVDYIKSVFGNKKIVFFTDGAPSQYKNKKNFLNLCMFPKDFGLNAEWNFFATSHGKSPCDALGGAFKRNAKLYNMRDPKDEINTAKKLFDWSQSIPNSKIHFIYCSASEYTEIENKLDKRFDQKIKRIIGTQSYHMFKPIDGNNIMASTLSNSIESKSFELIKKKPTRKH